MKPFIIEVCMGTSCYLLGTQDLLEVIEGLSEEKRARIEVIGATCLNTCGKGPNIKINGVVMSDITPERLLQILVDHPGGDIRDGEFVRGDYYATSYGSSKNSS